MDQYGTTTLISVIGAIIYLAFMLCIFAVLVLILYDRYFEKKLDEFPHPERTDKPKLRRVK